MSEDIVKRARAGDAAAIADLVRNYQRAAILTAHGALGDFHAAQDVAQYISQVAALIAAPPLSLTSTENISDDVTQTAT